jgi:prepilin-type N-terminal cleavage/methylation domain-containing protein
MKTQRNRGYTLVEMLVVVAISAVLLSGATRLFGDAWVAIRRATTHMQTAQNLRLVADRWRAVVRRTEPRDWQVADGRFAAGDERVFFDGRHVVFKNGDTERRIHLPGSLTGRFGVERRETGADCAVLTLEWERRYFRASATERVRIVGCAEKGAGQ